MKRFNELRLILVDRADDLEFEMCRCASEGEYEKLQVAHARYLEIFRTLKSMHGLYGKPYRHEPSETRREPPKLTLIKSA